MKKEEEASSRKRTGAAGIDGGVKRKKTKTMDRKELKGEDKRILTDAEYVLWEKTDTEEPKEKEKMEKKERHPQVYYWIGTHWLTPDEESKLEAGGNPWTWLEKEFAKGTIAFATGQVEKAPSSGRLHLQFFIAMKEATRVTYMQKEIKSCTWKYVFKTPWHAANYCHKPRTRDMRFEQVQWGAPEDDPRNPMYVMKSRGKSKGKTGAGAGYQGGVITVAELMRDRGLSVMEVMKLPDMELVSVAIRHPRGLEMYAQAMHEKAREEGKALGGKATDRKPLTVIFYHGPTRTGKSRRARAEIEKVREAMGYKEPFYAPSIEGDNLWWGGYNGQRCILFEELDHGNGGAMSNWLRLLDRYIPLVKIKGKDAVPFTAEWVWITSNCSLEEICDVHPGIRNLQFEALKKRMTVMEEVRQRSLRSRCLIYTLM